MIVTAQPESIAIPGLPKAAGGGGQQGPAWQRELDRALGEQTFAGAQADIASEELEACAVSLPVRSVLAVSAGEPLVEPAVAQTFHSHPDTEATVHVHAERQGEGVAVWLGVPGSVQQPAAVASAMLQHIRRSLEARGERLEAGYCNGRALARSPTVTATTNTIFHEEP